jgi:hypothetical protein
VTLRAAALSAIVTAALVLLAAWLLEVPLERAAVLAPVVIVAAAAVAGLAVFWARAAADSLRSARRPRLVAGSIVALVVLAVVLIVLGIELPRE